MATSKPEFELFDLKNDLWELNNLANDPDYTDIKDKLLNELNNWRENVIEDQGVTDTFRNGGHQLTLQNHSKNGKKPSSVLNPGCFEHQKLIWSIRFIPERKNNCSISSL